VHIEQPYDFQLGDSLSKVCKLKKALYGLKQALGALFTRFEKYLSE